MRENEPHLVESLLNSPFEIEKISDSWDTDFHIKKGDYKTAYVIVDKIKPILIIFYKNFIVDIWPNSYKGYGKRQLDYLKLHKDEISNKLMEISGLSEQQRQIQIDQNKTIKTMSCEEFLRSTSYRSYTHYFHTYMKKAHLPAAWNENYYKDDLENTWKEFYKGDGFVKETYFRAESYFSNKDEKLKNGLDRDEFNQFMYSKGGTSFNGGYTKYFSLKELDKGFEEFKTLKRKDSKFEENILKIESRLAESFEKTIKNMQKEGFLKEAKSFDLSFTGKSINIQLNENDLREDEEPSEEPFIDELYHMEEEYDIFNKEFYGKWPGSYAFYDEVLDNCKDTNADYDDIKDSYEFTDYDIDFCLDYIRGEDGENVAKKIFGTVENVEKSLIEYLNNRNNENNAFKQFLDYFRDGLEHHEEEDWNEQVQSAAGDWDAWNYGDEDEDYEDDDD